MLDVSLHSSAYIAQRGAFSNSYTFFEHGLTSERGFQLTFKSPKDEGTDLRQYGQNQYDHLIMYAPSTKGSSSAISSYKASST
jgi:hypothetical protein